MQTLLRRIGALALGLSLGLSFVHVPSAHASGEAAHHEAAQAPLTAHTGHDASKCGDCDSRDERDTPCDASHAVGCASMGACPVSMAESVGTPSGVSPAAGAAQPPQLDEPLSTHRTPDTPPPRA